MPAAVMRSNGEPLTGDPCPKYLSRNISSECARATKGELREPSNYKRSLDWSA